MSGWQYTPIETGWITGYIPSLADFQNVEKDIQTWGGNVDAAGNNLLNVGTLYTLNIAPVGGLAVTLLQINQLTGQYFSNDVVHTNYNCYKGRGTAASPLSVNNGDGLGAWACYGYGTSMTARAFIAAWVNGSVSGNNIPTDMAFYTCSAAATAEVFRLMSGGQLRLTACTAPGSNPAAGTFYLYMDSADNKLKARGPSGTVTTLASP